MIDPKDFNDEQKYPEGNPPEGDDISKHLDYLKEHGFSIEEGYFATNDWDLSRHGKHIECYKYGADQIRLVWELINDYDRQAISTICPNCKEKIRKDAITYCIECPDTKEICRLCAGETKFTQMICKECAKEER